jgi:hypothetical protein
MPAGAHLSKMLMSTEVVPTEKATTEGGIEIDQKRNDALAREIVAVDESDQGQHLQY